MKHLHSYTPGTRKWVHEALAFRAWTGWNTAATEPPLEDHQCLHIRGVAGSGKSVFTASTVREIQDAGAIVLFFFFRQIVDKNHSAKYLVSDFAAQLLPHSPFFAAALSITAEKHAVDGNEFTLVWPEIARGLAVRVGKKVFSVVDALDEMDDGDFDDAINRLHKLSTEKATATKVMMTSRPLPKIENALDRQGIVKLKLDPALLFPDWHVTFSPGWRHWNRR